MNNSPIVKPHKTAEYDFQQSKYHVAPRRQISPNCSWVVREWKAYTPSEYDTGHVPCLFSTIFEIPCQYPC